jgi:pilus assembly protein Flp/PilA
MEGMTTLETLHSTAGRMLARYCSDQSGATAVEYALVASGVGVAVAATVWALGSSVNNLFTTLAGLFP